VFPAILTATNQGTADDKAIFIFNGTMLNEVVREGQAARDGNGIFGDSTFGFFDPPFSPVVSLNNAGQVLVGASFTNTSSGLFESALVRFEEGAVTQLVREGEPAPDGNGVFGFIPLGDFNEKGEVIFVNRLFGTTGGLGVDDLGLFRADGVTVTQVARTPQPAPDANGTMAAFSEYRVNDASQAAFLGFLRGTSGGEADNSGIFLTNGGSVSQSVREGQLIPGGDGTFSGVPLTESSFIRGLAMNDRGQLAFMGGISNTIGGEFGVSRIDGITISQLVRQGDPAPDGNGIFDEFVVNGGIYLNQNGQVVFVATLANTRDGMEDNIGIFLVEGSTVVQLVREGQRAPRGGTFFGLNLNRLSALPEDGQVRFSVGSETSTG